MIPHTYVDTVIPPTSTSQGYTIHRCSVCGYQYIDSNTDYVEENPAKVVIESKKARAGKTVLVNVSLQNNPGIWGMDLRISYDKTAMTLTSVENGDFYQNSEWTKGNLNADVYTLSYEASGFDDITTASGTLATLNLKIKDNAVPGTYNVSATYNPGDIINVSFEDINFDISNGSITVKNRPVPVTGLALDKSTASVETGDGTLTLTPIFTPETATNKNIKWETSDDSIATVANGVVTLIKKGVVTITATTEDGNYSASYVVTINCSHGIGHDVPAEDSTCIKHGHGAYTVCNECGEIIEGSDAELPLGDHVGGTANCQHKAVCTVCGEEYGELGAHNYTEIVDSQFLKSVATCGSKALYYKSCSVCKAKETEIFEAGEYDYTNHVGETYKMNQKEATCFEEGYTGDTYCRTCDREISKGESIPKNAHNPASVWTTDETYHWKVCQTVGCGNIIDKAPHSGGEATCKDKAICSVCGAEYGELDSINHKHTEVRDAKAATEQEKGYTGDTWCLDCNKKVAEGKDIEKLEHMTVLVKAEEATAAKEGNIEYYYCENCDKYYSDEAGTKEITKEATVIAKLAPKIIEGNNAKIDKSSKEPVSFRSDAAFADFIRVEVDGKELVKGKDYTLKDDSIIVSLIPKFVATLTVGEHTLGIVSTSGTAIANFTVTADNTSSDNSEKSPQTGDNSNIAFWSFISVISLAALCTTGLIFKKKRVR